MNIFALNASPAKAAADHCDKHVVKMILETAQLLSTAHRVLDGVEIVGKNAAGRKTTHWQLSDPNMEARAYKASHINHPCSIWTREAASNYGWLWDLGIHLCHEYTRRYRKVHKCETLIYSTLYELPKNIRRGHMSDFALAMPHECVVPGDTVQSYRNYYMTHKRNMAVWNRGADEPPTWWQ